ncbi:MAG TPA: hypothetical protein VF799_11255 [Geobacteraceae bacterium]
MFNDETNEQIPLFGTLEEKKKKAPHVEVTARPDAAARNGQTAPKKSVGKNAAKTVIASREKKAVRKRGSAPAEAAMNGPLSGKVPEGDVRLTANMREDLHLKLKIAAARRRTTIGELLEELVDKYI